MSYEEERYSFNGELRCLFTAGACEFLEKEADILNLELFIMPPKFHGYYEFLRYKVEGYYEDIEDFRERVDISMNDYVKRVKGK